ncbi:XRE family transcriptional regulator [Phocaeicola sartorii]|uniref:XRE family transcriptional regulator n=1 Tax=Phocaeicola sartorii TaxID=671267 RepID=UPI002557FF3C|nr:XRE family transcriptional regulator [Phocaeicola sartorii]
MENLKERLLFFISKLGINKAQFEKEVGVSNGFVDKAGDNTRKSSLDRISIRYPQLNINWLLTGEGEMLKNNTIIQKIGDNCAHNTQVAGSTEVAIMQEKVKHLEELLKEKERMIQVLLDRK